MKSISTFAGVVAVGSIAITLSAMAGPLGGVGGIGGGANIGGLSAAGAAGGSLGASRSGANIGGGVAGAVQAPRGLGVNGDVSGNASVSRDGRTIRELRQRADNAEARVESTAEKALTTGRDRADGTLGAAQSASGSLAVGVEKSTSQGNATAAGSVSRDGGAMGGGVGGAFASDAVGGLDVAPSLPNAPSARSTGRELVKDGMARGALAKEANGSASGAANSAVNKSTNAAANGALTGGASNETARVERASSAATTGSRSATAKSTNAADVANSASATGKRGDAVSTQQRAATTSSNQAAVETR